MVYKNSILIYFGFMHRTRQAKLLDEYMNNIVVKYFYLTEYMSELQKWTKRNLNIL